ncbi:MAG TPA: tetratricopeptide repeat protein, partial [Terriglobia bacterium]|nr:tetratricopeptide repeat protein [Terriglobia bacterium]
MSALSTVSQRAGSESDGLLRRSRFRLVRRSLMLFVLLASIVVAGICVRPHLLAWYHRRAARLEDERYHNTQAIHHLLICRAIWPRDPETLLLASRAARRAQVYGDSELLLRIYREIRGRDEAYTFEHLLLTTECRVDEVSETCWKCIEQDRFDAPLLMEALTRGYLRQYRLGQARLCLNRWKELQPANPQPYYLEGLFQLDYLHDSPDAVNSYRRAVELDADHEEARLGLAVALLDCRNFAEAAEHFELLLQSQPENARVQVGVAECCNGSGDTAEAVRIVDDVLARYPNLPSALSLRGQLALKNGQWEEAHIALRQALRGNPLDHRARYSLVLCLERSDREEEARRERQQMQQMEQDVARFHEIVTKEIAERPTDPALHCTLGQLLLQSGQGEEGVRWLQSALHL